MSVSLASLRIEETRAQARELAAHLRARYPLQVSLSVPEERVVVISLLKVTGPRRAGTGTAALAQITRAADTHGWTLGAEPVKEFGSTLAGLRRLLAAAGFTPRGRVRITASVQPSMLRFPGPAPAPAPDAALAAAVTAVFHRLRESPRGCEEFERLCLEHGLLRRASCGWNLALDEHACCCPDGPHPVVDED